MQRQEVTKPPILTCEQKERLAKLEAMPDSQIDYSDIPVSLDWSNGKHRAFNESASSPTMPIGLDSDVVKWLANQDAETKRHINEVIRHIMVLRKV